MYDYKGILIGDIMISTNKSADDCKKAPLVKYDKPRVNTLKKIGSSPAKGERYLLRLYSAGNELKQIGEQKISHNISGLGNKYLCTDDVNEGNPKIQRSSKEFTSFEIMNLTYEAPAEPQKELRLGCYNRRPRLSQWEPKPVPNPRFPKASLKLYS
ncbi:hypothetical protein ACU8KH_01083 [Lachancea thermotolerans]